MCTMNFKINDAGSAELEVDSNLFEIMSLDREQLLKIFKFMYENSNSLNFDDAFVQLDGFRNPVEREVTKQILQKLRDFDENSASIKSEFDEKFPGIN